MNPGVELGNWLLENVQGLILALIAAVVTFYLIKRQTSSLFAFLGTAFVALVLVFSGQSIVNAAEALFKSMFGLD